MQELIQRADREPLAVIGADGSKSARPRKRQSQHLATLEQQLRLALGTR